MIKTLLKTLLLLATLGYLVFALVKVSRPAQDMVCTGVEYQFADSGQVSLIDRHMVEMLLARHKIAPQGCRLADIDVRNIGLRLSQDPYIDTATCYHTASGKLCIRIRPLHPLMHVFAQDGDEFYADRQGHIMPAGGLPTDLPVITGHVSRQFAATRLTTLAQLLCDDPYWRKQAQQVYVDQQGHVEIIPTYAGQRILLGEPKRLEDKLRRVRLFYEKGVPKFGWNKYNVINAAYNGQIICSYEK